MSDEMKSCAHCGAPVEPLIIKEKAMWRYPDGMHSLDVRIMEEERLSHERQMAKIEVEKMAVANRPVAASATITRQQNPVFPWFGLGFLLGLPFFLLIHWITGFFH